MNKKIMKNGSYSIIYTGILIAVLVVINLIVAEIPEEYTKIDVSSSSLYTMTDETKDFLDALDQEVTIYYIVQNGNEDDVIEKLLTKYDEYSKYVNVVKKDPVLYPAFTSQYTSDAVDENSLIVVCGDDSKVVGYYDMYQYSYDYYSYSSYVDGFDGEGQIDSAIAYVTAENLPILYFTEGHNEISISAALQESLEKANYQIKSLSLVASECVPEDAACLIIVSPQTDISAEEAEVIIEYLEAGGKAMFFIDYVGKELNNLDSVLENYGVITESGIVLEGDSNNYIMQMPYYMLPEVESVDFTSDIISNNRNILFALAQPFEILDTYRDTLEIESFLLTSEKAYLKENVENMSTFEVEDGDKVSEFPLAIKIKEEVDEEKQTQIVLYGGSTILDDSLDSTVSGANKDLVMASLSWMCENETPIISIESKDMSTTYLVIPEYDAGYLGVITCGVIPAAFLFIGLVIWFKRRKK